MRQVGLRAGSAQTETATHAGVKRRPGLVLATLGLSLVLATALAGGAQAAPPKNTAVPTLTGTPAVGDTLSCSQGTWSYYTARSYAWLRSGSPIAGQTSASYVVQAADQGHTISCEVTAGRPTGEYLLAGLPTGSYTVDFFPNELDYAERVIDGVSVTAGGLTSGIGAALGPLSSATGQISGRVTASMGNAALAGIEVCAEGATDECATTTSSGEYTISGLPSGSYAVEFAIESEYVEQAYTTDVTVTAPGTTNQINAALIKGAKISGKVTAAVGLAALAGVKVCAEGERHEGCATTNASGEYTIEGLPTNTYVVEFNTGSQLTQDSENEYEPRWYDGGSVFGAAMSSGATSISVTAGTSYGPYNVELEKGAKITGTVTATGGAPLAGIEVCAYATEVTSCTTTASGGQYTLEGLPAGSYAVQFESPEEKYVTQWYDDRATENEATPVAVAAQSTHPLPGTILQPVAHGSISGRVTAQGGGAIEEAEVCATGTETYYGQCATANAAGEYTIGELPSASYDVSVSAPGEANYVPQAVDGISVNAPGVTAGVNFALAGGGEITGSVTAADGGALGEVSVCAYNSAADVCSSTGTGTASAVSNAVSVPLPDNNFTLAKTIKLEAKTGDIDFYFSIPGSGSLKWSLFFKNSDVGFADALGLGLAGATAEPPVAEAAKKKKAKKAKKCKSGFTEHAGKCVAVLVSFGSSTEAVSAGTVEVKVHPSSRAMKALKAGHTLHVSGSFTFQSALGGTPVTHTESTVVHLPPPKKKSKKVTKKK